MLIRYQAEDKAQTINPTQTRGVSGLLQADKTVLIPEGNERMARRKPRVVSHGCGGEAAENETGSDGDSLRPILPLPMLGGNGSGSAANG
jgi:lysine 2,3-aminomutase